jgi:glycosyltransferase involved in cell wall biosynthesis
MVIRNGIPLADLEGTVRLNHPAIPNDMPLILWAGRFDLEKNVVKTFQAMVDAVSRYSAKAIICGSGPLRPQLEEILRTVPDASRVELWPYQAKLWPLMKRADVFISASFNEGSPNAVLEAMACRCALVVSDIPEHREFLSPECAEFVDPRSVCSISKGIQTVLTNYPLMQARIQKAYAQVLQFSVDKMVSRYEALYNSLRARLNN